MGSSLSQLVPPILHITTPDGDDINTICPACWLGPFAANLGLCHPPIDLKGWIPGHERELWQKESDAPVQLAASALPVGVQQGRSEPAGDPAPLYECPRPTDGSCCMRVSTTLLRGDETYLCLPRSPGK